MNIKQIRVVNLDIPLTPPKSKSRRPAADKVSARRAVPINYYEEFSTKFGLTCPLKIDPTLKLEFWKRRKGKYGTQEVRCT